MSTVATAARAQSPNILFIAVDDLRHWVNYNSDYPGTDIHGHSVHTPNIDALAASSTRYLNAYATMPQCTPSRTSVLFGMSPATHGMTYPTFSSGPEYDAIYNDPTLTTIPQALSASGYHSAAAGKIFNTQLTDRWDEWGPAIDYSMLCTPFSPGPDGTYMYAEVLPQGEIHPDQETADWGINFMNNYAASAPGLMGKPFFLALGFYQPHQPWRLQLSYYDLYPAAGVVAHTPTPGDLDDVPALGVAIAHSPVFSNGTIRQYDLIDTAGKAVDYTRAYLASISHTDDMVGQVMATLAGSAYASNTIVIFWSDHGYHLGEKFHWRKSTLWEPAVRVPLLISAPNNPDYPTNTDVTEAVSLLDIAATLVDMAGLAPEPQFEGAPLHDAVNRSPVEIYLNEGKATVSSGIKQINYDLNSASSATRSQYDLTSDPDELVNILPSGC